MSELKLATLPRRWLLLCGAGSGALHVAVYLAQRVIQRGPDVGTRWSFGAALATYILATCGLFALYAVVVVACRQGRIVTRRERRLAILIPVVFSVMLLPARPALSIDLYSYLAHGYVQAVFGENPYLVGAGAVAGTAFGREIAGQGWRPVHAASPYGPILTYLERAVVAATPNLGFEIILFKALVVAATLGSAALIWILLGRVRPDRQLLGTVVFLWNPLIIWELAGEGHNDAVMIVFVLLAVALLLQARYAGAIVVMSLAVLTKYIPLMLAPPAAAYAWRATRARRPLVIHTVLGGTIAAAITIVLFVPLWAGLDTFAGVRLNGAAGSTGSTPTMILEVLGRVAPGINWDSAMWGMVSVALMACAVWQARRVADGAGLLRAAAVSWLLYTLLISPTYWPWYAAPVVALLALVPERPFLTMIFAMSFAARLAAPLTMVYVHGLISRRWFFGSVWVIGVGMPLLVLARYAPVLLGAVRMCSKEFHSEF